MSKRTIEETLAREGVYASPTRGVSMRPMLRQGKDRIILVPAQGRLGKYDVPLYRRGKDYVLHRIVKVRPEDYVVLGDNCVALEYVKDEQIVFIPANADAIPTVQSRTDAYAAAGKTGSAEYTEGGKTKTDAWFTGFAPYDHPEISVTVNIPYGYSSGNAANLANHVYNYCFGKDSLESILSRDASYITSLNVSD